MSKIAAVILTLNEARHLPDCLASLTWCDEIWVVDSFSTDATVEIARRAGAHVLQHRVEAELPGAAADDPLEGHRGTLCTLRNWALDHLETACEWVLIVDADERIQAPLAREIRRRLAEDADRYAGYYIPRLQLFWGRWLRHGEAWPNYALRVFRRGAGRYLNREAHEIPVIPGEIPRLSEPMLHYSSESMSHAITRLNRATTLEAIHMLRTGQELYSTEVKSYSWKNQVLKAIFRWLPFKPLAKFCHDYFLRQGFRDGHQGFAWALLQGFYVWLAYFKLWELKQQAAGKDPARTPPPA